MRNLLFAGTALLCFFPGPALAGDPELAQVNLAAFESVDANDDGVVSQREVDHFRGLVMLSMDSDNDGDVTLAEYLAWDMGWQPLAEKRDRQYQYTAAREEVFKAWDRDGDGKLSPGEQRLSQLNDFYVASGRSNQPMDLAEFSEDLRIIAAMNNALSESDPVTLINVFTVPAGKEAEALAFWDAGAEFLRSQPGYVSTALHRAILPGARFSLINVAKWESVDAFQKATAAMRANAGIKPVDGLTFDASLYEVVRSD